MNRLFVLCVVIASTTLVAVDSAKGFGQWFHPKPDNPFRHCVEYDKFDKCDKWMALKGKHLAEALKDFKKSK